uniref:Uncharacterized protein n=1 Tax=Lotharella globosa TaxID=91324 RepID=A0A7S3Z0N2_9EUKA
MMVVTSDTAKVNKPTCSRNDAPFVAWLSNVDTGREDDDDHSGFDDVFPSSSSSSSSPWWWVPVLGSGAGGSGDVENHRVQSRKRRRASGGRLDQTCTPDTVYEHLTKRGSLPRPAEHMFKKRGDTQGAVKDIPGKGTKRKLAKAYESRMGTSRRYKLARLKKLQSMGSRNKRSMVSVSSLTEEEEQEQEQDHQQQHTQQDIHTNIWQDSYNEGERVSFRLNRTLQGALRIEFGKEFYKQGRFPAKFVNVSRSKLRKSFNKYDDSRALGHPDDLKVMMAQRELARELDSCTSDIEQLARNWPLPLEVKRGMDEAKWRNRWSLMKREKEDSNYFGQTKTQNNNNNNNNNNKQITIDQQGIIPHHKTNNQQPDDRKDDDGID